MTCVQPNWNPNSAGNEMNDNLLKSVWMGRLPPNVRTIISISSDPLDKLAILADKIMDVSDSPSLDAISVPRHEPPVQSTLEQQINLLVKDVAKLKTKFSQRPRSRSRSYGTESNGVSWYHSKYGDRAKKCCPPCRNAKN